MPIELPEALILGQQMNEALTGKQIECVHLAKCDSLIEQSFINLHQVDVTGRYITSVASKGKWIYVKLEPDMYLLFALETGGKLLYHSDETSLPDRSHVKLDFADGSFLTEQIVGWGWAKAIKEDELELHRYPGKQGISPTDDTEFTFEAFAHILQENSRKNLKKVLLDQSLIAGIGNGYLQDILFKSKIHPKRKAGELDEQTRLDLYQAIKRTLKEAIHLRGRKDEVDLYDVPGSYERVMGGHMKGKACPGCGTAIERLNVGGSSCYVCPACQRQK
jgi:formamidopyrimidine-DNA glycosylase